MPAREEDFHKVILYLSVYSVSAMKGSIGVLKNPAQCLGFGPGQEQVLARAEAQACLSS